MEKRQIILPSKRFFKANEEDLSIRLNLDESKNLLREDDRNIILDVSKLYEKERNESKSYKIYGKLKMVFRNLYSGTTEYPPLKENLYLVGDGSNHNYTGFIPYNEFAILRKDVLREVNTPISGDTFTNFTQNILLTTQNTKHKTITPITAPYHNWNLYLSYVYDKDTSFPMKYTLSGNTFHSFLSSDGIPFRVTVNGSYYVLTSPVEHGMSQGEYIIISGNSLNNSVNVSGRTFYITKVGNETYNSEKYVVNISLSQIPQNVLNDGDVVVCKRCLDIKNISGTTSEYYVHKHKTLTTINDYIMDKAGFESPIWETERKLLFENYLGVNDYLVERNNMEALIYDFKEPFVLTGITNNLGYTPTDIYLTIVFRNANGYFDYPPKIGYRFNFHDTWVDQHFSGSSVNENNLTYTNYQNLGYNFKCGEPLPKNSVLYGAFVEYNDYEFKERIVSEAYHKFNSPKPNNGQIIFEHGQYDPNVYSGVSSDNMVGLYYQPHYRIKLRQLSPYVENANTDKVYDLPENAKYYPDENLWKWRDLYEHGFIDDLDFGTDYPFINGLHYIKTDINFYLRNEKSFVNKKDGLIKNKNKIIDC